MTRAWLGTAFLSPASVAAGRRSGRKYRFSTANFSMERNGSGCAAGYSGSSKSGCGPTSRRCSPPRPARNNHPALRGAVHALVEISLGLLRAKRDVARASSGDESDRGAGRALRAIHAGAAEAARSRDARTALVASGRGAGSRPLPTGSVSLAPPPGWPPGFAEAMGWITTGPVLLRIDVAERISAELGWATRRGPVALPPNLGFTLLGEGRADPGGAALPRLSHFSRQ